MAKLKGILLLDKGHSCVGIGGILLIDDDTIRKYRNIYLNQGVTSLLIDHNKGRKPLFTAEQSKTLEKHICEDTYMGSKGTVRWIEKRSCKLNSFDWLLTVAVSYRLN